MFASAPARRGPRWIEPGLGRRRRRRPPVLLLLAGLALLAGAAALAVVLVGRHRDAGRERDAAERYARAWTRRDVPGMWRELDARSRAAYPRARFAALVGRADREATVRRVRVDAVPEPDGGRVALPVAATTRLFGTLRGTVDLPVHVEGGRGVVAWTPAARLPGLRAGEAVRHRTGPRPQPGSVLAADGRPLDATPATADLATGVGRMEAARINGRPEAQLRFGARVVERVPRVAGRNVQTTVRPGLQATAQSALGGRLGGVAVVRPRDGAVLALGGLAVSAPQPPGSTFKIITLSAALQAGIATPSSSYPVRTYALLSGVRLRNASDESCGGSLPNAFAVSCNSVFAPLGAKLGARRLVRAAEAFGFNTTPRVPAAKASTISSPAGLKDDLAVGAAAIGQDRDLATPLEMATVGATIATEGRRARPRVVARDPVVRRRVVPPRVARQVRSMMLGVVRGGTGTAAALPGIEVAGKTGTAELRPTAGGPSDPRNTDAWFVAFAPALAPKIAVAVMLVGAGAGGQAAAPIARQVLAAALG
jgi:penicillin-binding protein A